MTGCTKYDFTQHFIKCGRWQKVFDGLARQIVQAWGVEHTVVEETEVLHYGTAQRLYPEHVHMTSLELTCDGGYVPFVIARDVDLPNREFINACEQVFCRHFPVEGITGSEVLPLQKETLCFVLTFQLRSSYLLLLVPCKPFKQWEDILETFNYTSNCKADLSKERLSARHIDLQKADIEIKAYLNHSISSNELRVGNVITTHHPVDSFIGIRMNGNKYFNGNIGQSGGNKCIILHKEIVR